jgi:hypothetical protein
MRKKSDSEQEFQSALAKFRATGVGPFLATANMTDHEFRKLWKEDRKFWKARNRTREPRLPRPKFPGWA